MGKTDILPVLNSFWRVPVILAMTALLSMLSVFFSLIDGTGRLQHWCAHNWANFIFFVSRMRTRVEGLENIEPGCGYVFVANHLSMFDHWLFLKYLPIQFRFAAKSSLFKIPFLGWHLRRSGNLPVIFTNHRETLRAYKRVEEKIRSGVSFVIYPEGERTFDGVTLPFKRGAYMLARHAEAPIIPVTIIGAHLRLKRGSMVIRPGKMEFIVHPPIEYEEYKNWQLDELADKTRSIILERYRIEP
jgi:1-acyl-sn-glycerol-3-phosphate acyltransferase